MPAGSDTSTYTARLLGPDQILRGQANILSCPIWQSGVLIAPTSGTVTVYDPSNTAIVSGGVVTVAGSIASYTIAGAVLPSTLVYSDRWRVEWTLVIAGVTHMFRNDAALVRAALFPVVTDADLFRRVSSLDPNGSNPISSVADYQDYIDEAWHVLLGRLLSRGNRPNLIMSPSSLRDCHLLLTLHYIFSDFATRLEVAHLERAQTYWAQYQLAWTDLRFVYDETDTGESVSVGRRSANPTIWLCGR